MAADGPSRPSSPGASPGDLYIFLSVKEHPHFKRDGQDLLIEVPISFSQAALGDSIQVPTLQGEHKLNIPAGTQNGKQFTISKEGLPNPGQRNSSKGNLFVEIRVETPTHLTDKMKDLFAQLAEEEGLHLKSHKKSWFEQIKESIFS